MRCSTSWPGSCGPASSRRRGEPMAKRRTSAESGEDLLIARHFKPIARHPGALGLVDDAALLAPPAGHELVLTADAIVGGVHFFSDDPPDAVARKALGVNLSDLAAKGAKPAGFLLTLALAEGSPRRVAQEFCARARRCGEAFRLSAARRRHRADAGPVTISITAFGTVRKGTMVRRSGARAGDRIVVTGTIGDAALGLKLRTDRRRAETMEARCRHAAASRLALSRAAAAQRRGRGGSSLRQCRRWTFRTGSPAISGSCFAHRASARRSRLRKFRCRRPRGPR